MTSRITRGELAAAGFQAGQAWLTKASLLGLSTPWTAAGVAGISLLHAFFNNPKPTVALDDGQQSPDKAQTYPDEPPFAQWAIGPALVGGAIVYAHINRFKGPNDKKRRKVLHLAIALTEGSLPEPDILYVWINGRRTEYERQETSDGHLNPDGTTTDWYEPVSDDSGARVFVGYGDDSNGEWKFTSIWPLKNEYWSPRAGDIHISPRKSVQDKDNFVLRVVSRFIKKTDGAMELKTIKEVYFNPLEVSVMHSSTTTAATRSR